MPWEERNGKLYYYRKRRVGQTVISEYAGAGKLGELAEQLDELERLRRLSERQAEMQARLQFRELEGDLNQVDEYMQTLARASLLLAGYHQHKGQWRRIRDA